MSDVRSGDQAEAPPMPSAGYRRTVTILALLAPLAGFLLLVAQPQWDVQWEHHPAHFWLVLTTAIITGVLAYATGEAARRRHDARVFLVSMAFLSAAGFLGLHALATPAVLLEGSNPGFALATPVGLAVASVFAAWSSLDLSGARAEWIMRRSRLLLGLLLAVMAIWAGLSLGAVPPLNGPIQPERASGPLVAAAAVGFVLYVVAVVRYLELVRRSVVRRAWAALPIAMAAGFTLLAEAEIAVAWGRNWHLTWWEWHLLMLAAFGIVAITAQRSWPEERYVGVYLPETARGRREISVLFADLQGFTSFSEQHDPIEVQAMLNSYFDEAIPPVLNQHGGVLDRLIGDAIMATFNTLGDQPDHPERAARAALAIQEVTSAVADEHPDWPRFRVGINTGEAAVGVLAGQVGRTYTVVGDVVNLAARLEGKAPVGGVALGAETARRLPGARIEMLGRLQVKGKAEPVDVYRLVSLGDRPG